MRDFHLQGLKIIQHLFVWLELPNFVCMKTKNRHRSFQYNSILLWYIFIECCILIVIKHFLINSFNETECFHRNSLDVWAVNQHKMQLIIHKNICYAWKSNLFGFCVKENLLLHSQRKQEVGLHILKMSQRSVSCTGRKMNLPIRDFVSTK